MKRIVLLGATGLVGQQVLQRALVHRGVTEVIAPTRRPLPGHVRLFNPLVDFEDLPTADWWQADAAICTLGSTLRQAGSKAAFFRIDHDYVLNAARLLREAGTPVFALNSSLGADAHARSFYLQVKGTLEQDVRALQFPSLTIVRPSLLDGGPRPDSRPAEKAALVLAHVLRPLLPPRYRAVSTTAVAHALFEAALTGAGGEHVIESERLA